MIFTKSATVKKHLLHAKAFSERQNCCKFDTKYIPVLCSVFYGYKSKTHSQDYFHKIRASFKRISRVIF